MANPAQKVEFRVYIEGHQIPVSGITLTIYDGQRTQGYLVTTPSDAAKKIPPMSTVAIFYYDNNYGTWCLFWEGIYTGWQFNKSPMSRSISLQVSGWGVLQDKVCAYMTSSEEEIANSIVNVYGTGNSNWTKMEPAKSGDAQVKVDYNLANLAVNYLQPRGVMDFQNIAKLIAKEGATDFYTVARKLTESLTWLNPLVFYRYINSKFRYKVAAVKDDKFQTLFEYNTLQSMISGFANTYFRERATANNFIDAWMSQIFYSRSELVSPPIFNTGSQPTMTQQLYVPRSYFNIPPVSNVLFPEFINSISYADNFMAHPTRLLLKSNPLIFGNEPSVQLAHFYSDRTEYENSKDILAKMKDFPQNMFLQEYSADEYEKYPMPAVDTLNDSIYYTLLKQSKDKESESARALFGSATHYMYMEHKYGVRPITITGTFNPYFVVGFPCVVLDQECSFMAKPLSVTYNINASGDASTSYMCNFAIPLEKDDLLDARASKFPVLPGWLPSAYSPTNIDNTYGELLGRNKDGDAALGGAKNGYAIIDMNKTTIGQTKETIVAGSGVSSIKANISSLVDKVFNLDRTPGRKLTGGYDTAGDKLDFARKYVLRGMTTFEAYQKFYAYNPTGDSKQMQSEPGRTISDTSNKLYSHVVKVSNVTGSNTFFNLADANNPSVSIEDYINNQTSTENTANIVVDAIKFKHMNDIAKQMWETAQRG